MPTQAVEHVSHRILIDTLPLGSEDARKELVRVGPSSLRGIASTTDLGELLNPELNHAQQCIEGGKKIRCSMKVLQASEQRAEFLKALVRDTVLSASPKSQGIVRVESLLTLQNERSRINSSVHKAV
jgi:hypothetical protein